MANAYQKLAVVGWLAFFAGLLGMAAPWAQAQNQMGDGHNLDNNLQRGSGGVNQTVAQPDYYARNAIITGNVPGLAYFHGPIINGRVAAPYMAPGDYQGTLAGDSLFRFRAQSLGNYSALPGHVGGAPSYQVYRQFAPTSVGELGRGGPDLLIGGSSGLIVRPSETGLVPRTFESGVPATGTTPIQPDYFSVQGNQVQPMTSSPLLGLRSFDLGVQPSLQGVDVYKGTAPPSDFSQNPAEVARRNAQQLNTGPGAVSTNPVFQKNWPDATLALGEQIQALVKAQRIEQIKPLADRVAQIEASVFSPLGSRQVKPGEDVYMDLLAQMKANALLAQGKAPQTPTRHQGLVPTPSENAAQPSGAEAAASGFQPVLPQPTAEQLAQARQQRDRARALALGLPVPKEGQTNEGGTPAAGSPGAPAPAGGTSGSLLPDLGFGSLQQASKNPAKAHEAREIQRFLNTLRDQGPALGSLAGRRKSIVNGLLAQAEVDLRENRYFDAESKYRQAEDLAPNNPLVRIGLVHAELGAGMIRSAAYNLRLVFGTHPELIAVRYQPRLLPNIKRLAWMQGQLQDMIHLSRTRTEPCLLMAYLGYQFRQPQLVEYGLDLAEARAPLDPLWPVLRQLWQHPGPSAAAPSSTSPMTGGRPDSGAGKPAGTQTTQ